MTGDDDPTESTRLAIIPRELTWQLAVGKFRPPACLINDLMKPRFKTNTLTPLPSIKLFSNARVSLEILIRCRFESEPVEPFA